MPTNGSVGTLTFSPRYLSQIGDVLERERFDVLHFHEPFVPFLSLFLLRESTSVNVATFHAYAGFSPSYEFGSRALRGYAGRLHGRIAVSAAARHFIDRYFPGDYKVIPNGVDIARYVIGLTPLLIGSHLHRRFQGAAIQESAGPGNVISRSVSWPGPAQTAREGGLSPDSSDGRRLRPAKRGRGAEEGREHGPAGPPDLSP